MPSVDVSTALNWAVFVMNCAYSYTKEMGLNTRAAGRGDSESSDAVV